MIIKVIAKTNCLPIEGREGKIFTKIIPISEDSRRKFEITTSINYEHITAREMIGNINSVDLSDGAKGIRWGVSYPTCANASITVYVIGLLDDDVLLDENDVNSTLKTRGPVERLARAQRDPIIPKDTRYLVVPIKIYSWLEILLFFFAGISTIGAITEIISLLHTFGIV